MRQKTLVTICGAAVAGSLFLPWVTLPAPVGTALIPWDMMRQIPAIQNWDWQAMLDLPRLMQAFLASFAFGALVALLAVIGWAPRALALIAGLLPFGLAGYVWLSARDQVEGLGLTLPTGDIGSIFDGITQIAGYGFYLWAGGAALLLIVALLDPGDRY